MKSAIYSGLIFVFFLSGCERKTDMWTEPGEDFNIIYNQRSGWTGWQFNTCFTYPDSLIVGERITLPGLKERTSKYLIAEKEMDSLLQGLYNMKSIKLKDYGFGSDKPTDYPITFFKYKNHGFYDSCFIYLPDENELPGELVKEIAIIKRIIAAYELFPKKNRI